MRRLLLATITCTVATSASAADVAPQPPALQVRNIAQSFADFYEANKDKPGAEQVAAFKKTVAPGFPAFYGVQRYQGERTQAEQDKLIEGAVKDFAKIRDGYLRKTQQFETELPRYITSFKAWFPDYAPSREVYVLHSLGEMDGGTRTFGGKEYLIFGVDGMVRYHGTGRESAFFHHELFHTYHEPQLSGCSDNAPVWSSLWTEGLATYVSKAMNPDSNDVELLLDFPGEMAEQTRKVLPASFAHLEQVLEKTDRAISRALFSSGKDDTGLPPRRGYYLGYLVAEQAAKKYDVRELAKFDCKKAHEVVVEAVHVLSAAYRPKL
jgi:opacity protein-like surface antigen